MKNKFLAIVAMGLFFGITINQLNARQPQDIIAHMDVFGMLQRPPAIFSHNLHVNIFSDQGCGICHHVPDENSGELVYRDGEELACKDCHGKEKKNKVQGLREAYHASCTACHLSGISNGQKSGPVTCGECHPK